MGAAVTKPPTILCTYLGLVFLQLLEDRHADLALGRVRRKARRLRLSLVRLRLALFLLLLGVLLLRLHGLLTACHTVKMLERADSTAKSFCVCRATTQFDEKILKKSP